MSRRILAGKCHWVREFWRQMPCVVEVNAFGRGGKCLWVRGYMSLVVVGDVWHSCLGQGEVRSIICVVSWSRKLKNFRGTADLDRQVRSEDFRLHFRSFHFCSFQTVDLDVSGSLFLSLYLDCIIVTRICSHVALVAHWYHSRSHLLVSSSVCLLFLFTLPLCFSLSLFDQPCSQLLACFISISFFLHLSFSITLSLCRVHSHYLPLFLSLSLALFFFFISLCLSRSCTCFNFQDL